MNKFIHALGSSSNIGVNNETNTPDDKYFILKCKNFARALVSSNKHFFVCYYDQLRNSPNRFV